MEDNPIKKAPLLLNWNTLMPKSKDDDPSPELVFAGDGTRSYPPGTGDFGGMSDFCIEEEINRQKGNLEKLRNLPDNGEKLRVRLRMLEDERERRKLRRVDGDGSEKPTQSDGGNLTSALGDLTETPSSSPQGSRSEFFAHFNKKFDERNNSRSENPSEFSYSGYGSRGNSGFGGQISRGRKKSPLPSCVSPFQCQTKLSTDAEKRKFSNGDQNGHCYRNYEEVSPVSLKKRQRPSPFLASKGSRQNNQGKTYVLVDEEETEPERETEPIAQMDQVEEADECMKDSKIYYPTRDDPESVEICYLDMQCLAPQAFLSSTVMNFYIRHLQELTLATERRNIDYHFFNTYFYSKLQKAVSKKDEKESSFPKLRRWWKGVDIFHRAYILLPVHEDLHWSLVIICIPDKEDDSGPIILHLDSLGIHSSRSIFNNVKSFLIGEWKHLIVGEAPPDLPISNRIWKNLSRRIDEKVIEVPQQKNEYDCGLFVLYFMERFIAEAPQRLKRKDLAMFGRKWFKAEEASELRKKIKKLLKEEFRKATQDDRVSPQLPTVATQEQKDEQPKGI